MSQNCPQCGEANVAGASFCEACGSDLPVGPPCVSCGAGAGEIDGEYCLQCGHRQPGERDHVERVDGRVVGVTDRGNRHHRNEDAMALADLGDALVLVVCDGVSTTDRPDEASQVAADVALGVLTDAVAALDFDPDSAFAAACTAAQAAVIAVPHDNRAVGNPSCTFAAAVVQADGAGRTIVHVGWLGDSRVYWMGHEPLLLTRDHSWAFEVAASTDTSLEDAMADPRAHTITRFLGADAVDVTPSTARHVFDDAGCVLVCTDGLWNYAPEADALASRQEWVAEDRLDQAAGLVAFAGTAGGHDNITVVLGALGSTATRPRAGTDGSRGS